jgi:hypothetical protein
LRQDRLGHVDFCTTLGDNTISVSDDDRKFAAEIGLKLCPICVQVEEVAVDTAENK